MGATWGEAGHGSVGGEPLYCASLVLVGFYLSLPFITIIIAIIFMMIFYFVSITKLILYQPMTFSFVFLVLHPIPLVGWRGR